MKRMVNYALCVTIRDKQLKEKKDRLEDEHKLSLKKDVEMEIIRLQKLKFYNEMDEKNYVQKKLCQNFVIDQINQKSELKKNDKKHLEKEYNEAMQHMSDFYHDQAEELMKHKRNQFERNQEIYDDNQNKYQDKIIIQKQILEDEKKIENYIKQKNLKQQQEEQEQQIKRDKEKEIFKLGTQQQVISDKQKQLELLIEKRQQASIERKFRVKELQDAEIKAKKIKELWEVRNNQIFEKIQIQNDQAELERDEYQQNLKDQQDDWILECKLQDARQQLLNQNLKNIKQQMVENENKKMIQNRDRLEESKKVKDNLLMQKLHLEQVKEEKLEFLQVQGIQKKYMAELNRKKIFGVS